MSTSFLILSELQDGHFHSGQELANKLGISRSAVWKSIQLLSHKGLDIHSVRGRGYKLKNSLELLNVEKIESYLPDDLKNQFHIETHFELDSTNQYLLQNRSTLSSKADRTVCLAEYQTSGRGRRGRKWLSPLGANIYFSILIKQQLPPSLVPGLSLVTALAITNSLQQHGAKNLELKWPNDILCNGKKMAGILLETSGEIHGEQNIVVGVGLNVSMPNNFDIQIGQPWTDFEKCSGRNISRNEMVSSLLVQLNDYYNKYKNEGMECMLDEWRSYDAYHGKEVSLMFGEQTVRGVVCGLDDFGGLRLKDVAGEIRTYHSGEVSLRPVD